MPLKKKTAVSLINQLTGFFDATHPDAAFDRGGHTQPGQDHGEPDYGRVHRWRSLPVTPWLCVSEERRRRA
jgi:hypothetical protein